MAINPAGFINTQGNFQFSTGNPSTYLSDATNYLKQFMGTDGYFSTASLSQAFGTPAEKAGLIQNLDLNGNNKIDLKEAVLGLLYADYLDNPGAVADGQITRGGLQTFQNNFINAVQIGPSGTQAEHGQLNQIDQVIDRRGKLSAAVDNTLQSNIVARQQTVNQARAAGNKANIPTDQVALDQARMARYTFDVQGINQQISQDQQQLKKEKASGASASTIAATQIKITVDQRNMAANTLDQAQARLDSDKQQGKNIKADQAAVRSAGSKFGQLLKQAKP